MKRRPATWAVVHVWRGIPNSVELFSRKGLARQRERELREQLPQEDENGLFEVALPAKTAGLRPL